MSWFKRNPPYYRFFIDQYVVTVLENNVLDVTFTDNLKIDEGTTLRIELKVNPVMLEPGRIIPRDIEKTKKLLGF